MKSVILVFNFSAEKLKRLRQCFVMSNFLVKEVNKKDFGLPLVCLTDENFQKKSVNSKNCIFSEEMFVMCGFSDDQMQNILSILKQNNIQIPLKAVLTKTNSFWSANQLFKALKSEQSLINNK